MTGYAKFREAIKRRDFVYLESNRNDPAHRNGLFDAAALNAPEVLAYFLAKGEDIDGQPEETEGNTPLMAASVSGSLQAVEYLLAMGADPLRANDKGKTALDIAERKKHHTVVAAFRTLGLEASLIYLLENDYDTFLEQLRLPDVALTNCWGRSVIPELILRKRDELARSLLLNRGGINVPGKEGVTCLHAAILRKNTDLARFLLENGADPNCIGDTFYEETPLMLAINLGVTSLWTILVDSGADVNGIDTYGSTALIHAIRKRSVKAVEFLLANGADPYSGRSPLARDDAGIGKDVWETARKQRSKEIIHLLEEAMKRAQTTDLCMET